MTSIPRKICIVLVDRANYGRLKPLMKAIQADIRLKLQVVSAGTMVLERFQKPVELVLADGFPVDAELHIEIEGSTPATMAKSIGLGIIEFTSTLERLDPDIVVVIGDRYETLAASVAAAYSNRCLVHVQGGELSGSIDECTRHAITRLAHFHVPSTQQSAEFLLRMGERAETILSVGCPSSDLARTLDLDLPAHVLNLRGSGVEIDVQQPFLLCVFHPTTSEFGDARGQVMELLQALHQIQIPTAMLWPNIDAGADQISKAIRVFRDEYQPGWLRLITNLSPDDYLRTLATAACAVGNSSSFVRDAGFFGTPVVLVGNRQAGREGGEHVLYVPVNCEAIADGLRSQLATARYPSSDLYGDGHVARRVTEALATLTPYLQKRLSYAGTTETSGIHWENAAKG